MQERRDKEMKILDQLYDVYGNLQDMDVVLQLLSEIFHDKNEQKMVQVLDALHYHLENILKDFSAPVSEYDLMMLHS